MTRYITNFIAALNGMLEGRRAANIFIVLKIMASCLAYFLIVILVKDAYLRTNILHSTFKDTISICGFGLHFTFLFFVLYYASRTIQKELYIFKKINQKERPIPEISEDHE